MKSDLLPSLTKALSITERLTDSDLKEKTIDFISQRVTSYETDRWVADYLRSIDKNALIGKVNPSADPFDGAHRDYDDWQRDIYEALRNFTEPENFLADFYRQHSPTSSFIDIAEPITQFVLKAFSLKLEARLGGPQEIPFELDGVLIQLKNKLAATLFEILNKTLILEINVSRLRGELEGETPQDRFIDFNRQLRTPEKRGSLMEEYPVAFRKVYEFSKLWEEDSLLFLERLRSDWDQLHTFFGIEAVRKMGKIRFNAGDRHNGAHAVAVLTFGGGKTIVYKPRSLSVDVHFQSLLNWINSNGNLPALRTLAVLERQDYGWVEYIEHLSCDDTQGLARYYQRIGQLLAILYCINATDFHFENLIAAGENPVLIDLESLFHVEPKRQYGSSITEAAETVRGDSVLKIQLLPFKLSIGSEILDLSALSNPEAAHKQTLLWHAEGSDEMCTIRGSVQLGIGNNVPKLNGEVIALQHFHDHIVDAFRKVYDLISANKHQFLGGSGLINDFGQDSIRILLRPTDAYSQLLRASLHPDYLRDQVERELLLSRLWDRADSDPDYYQIACAERAAIERLDIPLFTTRPNSLHLWADKRLIVQNYFEESGLDKVQRKIRNLSIEDQDRQVWFILASLASTNNKLHREGADVGGSPIAKKNNFISRNFVSKAIHHIAAQFKTTAILKDGYAQWLGVILTDGTYEVKPLMLDLYSGSPGVAIYLASMVKYSGKEEYKRLFQASLNTIDQEVERYLGMNFTKRMGAFDGWAGILYSYLLCGQLLDDRAFEAKCATVANHIITNLSAVHGNDIISGKAGVLLSLTRLYEIYPSTRIASAIQELVGELMMEARPQIIGEGWSEGVAEAQVGFGHGVAGIAYALHEANRICPINGCLETVERAILYESSQYNSGQNNWEDHRNLVDGSPMVGWCSGASGIGLSRLNSSMLVESATIRTDISRAIKSTKENGFGANISLCHGDSGNIDFLLQASLNQRYSVHYGDITRQSKVIANKVLENQADYGIGTRLFNPALMVGGAGVGYQLLRIKHPDIYPSILLLQTPKINKR